MSLEFHEYSRIFKRPIPASYFKVFQALGITWIFKNIQPHKSWKFLEIPSSIFLQAALASLHVSSHTLAIETGRNSKPEIQKENELCKYYGLNEVEDEQDFLLRCTLCETLRRNLLKAIGLETNLLSDRDTFLSLKSSQDGKKGNGHFCILCL